MNEQTGDIAHGEGSGRLLPCQQGEETGRRINKRRIGRIGRTPCPQPWFQPAASPAVLSEDRAPIMRLPFSCPTTSTNFLDHVPLACSIMRQPLLRPKLSGLSSSYWILALGPPSPAVLLKVPASWKARRRATAACRGIMAGRTWVALSGNKVTALWNASHSATAHDGQTGKWVASRWWQGRKRKVLVP